MSVHVVQAAYTEYPIVRFVDAPVGRVIHFYDVRPGFPEDVADGVLHDRWDLYKQAVISGSEVVIERHSGETMKFELFDENGIFDIPENYNPEPLKDQVGRLTEWFRGGVGYTIDYGDEFDFTTITDASGRTISATWDGTKRAGRPALASLTFSDGRVASFGYSGHILSSVTLGESGQPENWKWTNSVGDGGNNTVKMDISSPTRGRLVYRFHDNYRGLNCDYLLNPLRVLHSVRMADDSTYVVRVAGSPDDVEYVIVHYGDGTFTMVQEIQLGVYCRFAASFVYDPNEPNDWDKYGTLTFPAEWDQNYWPPSGGTNGNGGPGGGNGGGNGGGGGIGSIAKPPRFNFAATPTYQPTPANSPNANTTLITTTHPQRHPQRPPQPSSSIASTTSQSTLFHSRLSILHSRFILPGSSFILYPSFFAPPPPPPINGDEREWLLGAPPHRKTDWGEMIDLEYDAEYFLVKRTYSDATTETFLRNTAKQIIRYKDRLNRVTRYEYSGMRLTKRIVGILDNGSGGDVNTADYAVYESIYDGSGRLIESRDPLYNPSFPELHSTIYTYASNVGDELGLLATIQQSADEASQARPTTTLAWTSNGHLAQVEDPLGHITFYTRDPLGRATQTQFPDGTTEQSLYGTAASGQAGLVVASKNRVNVVDTNTYDSMHRVTERLRAAAIDSDILDGQPHDLPITDPLQRSLTTYVYHEGSRLQHIVTRDGRKTEILRDGLGRTIESRRYPHSTATLIDTTVYKGNRALYREDPFERRTFYGYRAADGVLTRTVTETKPGGTGLSFSSNNADVLALTRDTSNNAAYLVSDNVLNAESETTQSIDPRGIETTFTRDSRGREIVRIDAAAGIAAKTETDYDLNSNTLEVRTPRYFDSSDPAYHKAYSTFTYTGRNQVATSTQGAGAPTIAATTSYTYYADGRSDTTTDANGEDWKTVWEECCGVSVGRRDPLGHGNWSSTDSAGHTTHSAVISDFDSHTDPLNPIDSKTLSETTTQFDPLGRAIGTTRWLVPLGPIDRQNPPLAGFGGVLAADGLTTLYVYDSNLTDGVGLDHSGGITVDLPGGGDVTISLATMLSQLADSEANGGANLQFTAGNAASGFVTIDPELVISASISDGTGRTVITGLLDPSTTPNPLITWSCQSYDHVVSIGTFGSVEETRSIDATGNVSRSRSDGAGRTLQSVDEANQVTQYVYDPQSNVVQTRDPNNVGFDAVYDGLGRQTSSTDTQNDTTASGYDLEGNTITATDAKSKVTSFAYDALGRQVSTTDRLNGVTSQTYDKNNNLLTITDSENKVTSYEYNIRNEKIKETYADHTGGNPGDAGYGIVEVAFDPAGRLQLRTDQNGDTQTLVYDMASRLLQRDYRTKANSPSGTIADSDVMTYDTASRLLTGHSSRYDNTIGRTYDNVGRVATESLTIASRTYTVSHEYDLRSMRKKTTYPNGSTWERSYTARRQLHETQWNSNVIDTRSYDDGGRLTDSAYGNGVTNHFAYRNDNLLSSISHTHPSGTATTRQVGTYSYTWDANKNKTKETISGQIPGYSFDTTLGVDPDGYDDEDRLIYYKRQSVTDPQLWSLSLVGDWTSHDSFGVVQDRTHSATHEVESVEINSTIENLQHDVKGNVTSIPANAHPFLIGLTWDFDNQLVSADVDDDQTADVTFEYDVLKRRVARTPTVGTARVYIHAGNQIIADYDRGASSTSTPAYRYVWGSYIDEPILRIQGSSTVRYYHRNQQYSTTAITSSTGLVVERYVYTAYGGLQVLSPFGGLKSWSDNSNRYTYTGREWDNTIHLYNFRARQYSPHLGRFLTRDPLGYVDGMSLYGGYFAVRDHDPFGRISESEPNNQAQDRTRDSRGRTYFHDRRGSRPRTVVSADIETVCCKGRVRVMTQVEPRYWRYNQWYISNVHEDTNEYFLKFSFNLSEGKLDDNCECHWIQFWRYNRYVGDKKQSGYSFDHGERNLVWRENAVLLDIPPNEDEGVWLDEYSMGHKLDNEVTFFDNPTIVRGILRRRVRNQHDKVIARFETMLVCNCKVAYAIIWERECERNHDGKIRCDDDVKWHGTPRNHSLFEQKEWRIGIDCPGRDRKGNPLRGPAVNYRNPCFDNKKDK